MADKGFIVFTIGIHGVPVNMDQAVYNDLNNGALKIGRASCRERV